MIELLSYTPNSTDLDNSQYSYEMWNHQEKLTDINRMQWYGPDERGGAAFRLDWEVFVHSRLGLFFNCERTLDSYKDFQIKYKYRTKFVNKPAGVNHKGGYIGAYGWIKNPNSPKELEQLIEYYVVNDWFDAIQLTGMQVGYGCTKCKKIGEHTTKDGSHFSVYSGLRINYPSPFEQKRYSQVFFVRTGISPSGVLYMHEHFNKLRELISMEGATLWEVKYCVESWNCKGFIDFDHLSMTYEAD
jgi:hypothetical protein